MGSHHDVAARVFTDRPMIEALTTVSLTVVAAEEKDRTVGVLDLFMSQERQGRVPAGCGWRRLWRHQVGWLLQRVTTHFSDWTKTFTQQRLRPDRHQVLPPRPHQGPERTNPETLRRCDALGLLTDARVDPVTGYRLYAPEQLDQARLVAWLRRQVMPLTRIQHVRTLSAGAAALKVRAIWAQVEAATPHSGMWPPSSSAICPGSSPPCLDCQVPGNP